MIFLENKHVQVLVVMFLFAQTLYKNVVNNVENILTFSLYTWCLIKESEILNKKIIYVPK